MGYNRGSPNRLWFGLLAVGWIPACIALDTVLALLRGWSIPALLKSCMIVAASTLVVLLSVIVAWRRSRLLLSTHWRLIGRGSACLALAGLGIEVVCTCCSVDPEAQLYHRKLPGQYNVVLPRLEDTPGIQPGGRYTINSQGVRGPEMPERASACRILCIGGRTTENLFLDDRETWPSLVMERLNGEMPGHRVWIGDIGTPGYGTWHQLRFLERSNLPEQVDVMLFLVGVNDFLWYVAEGVESDPVTRASREPPLWKRSRLFYLLRRNSLNAITDEEANQLAQLRATRRASAHFDELPDLPRALEDYAARVARIVAICRKKGITPIFATEPALWSEDLSPEARRLIFAGWSRDEFGPRFLTLAKLREGMEAYNRTLLQTCAELGVDCIDLRSMNANLDYYYDDVHYTPAGSHAVGRLVSEWFLHHPPVRRAPRSIDPRFQMITNIKE